MHHILRSSRGWALALAGAALLALIGAGSAHAGCQPGVVYLQSVANGKWVSAEYGRTGSAFGMLRARASTKGSWEKFYMTCIGSHRFVLSSTRGLMDPDYYVSAELGHPGTSYGMLRARASTAGAWETFEFEETYRFSRYTAEGNIRSLANGKYVAAEIGNTGSNYGMLRARADKAGFWERFRLHWPYG